MRPSEVLEQYREAIRKIVLQLGMINPRLFGSAQHGDDVEGSELDILVSGGPKTSLFDLAGLQLALESHMSESRSMFVFRRASPQVSRNGDRRIAPCMTGILTARNYVEDMAQPCGYIERMCESILMIRLVPLILATSAVVPVALAQSNPVFTDPANLRGERVRPSDGRELPLDRSEAEGGRGLEGILRRLNTRASILNIVAHPDDEDGGMLAFYSRGLGARVADMSLTRGEGGQNAMTGDFEDALGLLRTQELLSSDRYPGIGQFFGTEVDFGFSKTKEEAFGKWTHERVLYDVVRAIRLYRPLVLTSTFIGGVTDGHGHHQVSGQITQEAFNAAGDPKVFPELTAEGILPWQPLRVYARVPQQAITPQGLFDYATGQYTPARFTNYVTGEVTTTPPSTDVVVHEGKPDPLLTPAGANPADLPASLTTGGANGSKPLSYVQFSRIGLGLQRSQIGPGVRNAPAGAFDSAYHLYGSRVEPCSDGPTAKRMSAPTTKSAPATSNCPPERSGEPAARLAAASSGSHDPTFFTGIDTSITGIASLAPSATATLRPALAKIAASIKTATAGFTPTHPSAIAPTLAESLRETDALLASLEKANLNPVEKASILHELRIKRVQLNQALILALGLSYTADAPASDIPIHTAVIAKTHLAQSTAEPVTYKGDYSSDQDAIGADEKPLAVGSTLAQDHPLDRTCSLDAATSLTPTRPYFSRTGPEQAVYNLSDPSLRSAPVTPPALTCLTVLSYKGVLLSIAAVATHTAGETAEPVSLVPPVTLALSSQAQVLPAAQRTAKLSAVVNGVGPAGQGTLALHATNGWAASPATAPVSAIPIAFTVLPSGAATPTTSEVHATATVANTAFAEAFRPIGYPGVPRTNFYIPATTRIVPADLQLPEHLRLGYLPGTGDSVPEALASIGLHATALTVADLTAANLAHFDTVVLGVRTYSAHPDLHGAPTQALLDFARDGGNVILQYQTAEFTAADAPFPLTLGRDAEKVVDEAAGVQLLDVASPLLSTPNRIATADFGGWIEERGHGFLRTWDPKYTALTETHDPGQEPQRGGLVTVALGKGRWTYVAFALYRQLPEAVPGSFRLLVNLLNPASR